MIRALPLALVIAMFWACTKPQPAPPDAASQRPAAAVASDAGRASEAGSGPGAGAPSDEVVARVMAPWTGDLDGMVKRRYVRVLVAFSRTDYFLDGPQQHGIQYDAGKLFESFLNARQKLKNDMVHVVFIPVSRDRIFDELARGRGDIAAVALTITPERQRQVDFASPFLTGVREVLVTAADQPAASRAEDLSGRTVHVRRSSSYFESLTALNHSLTAAGKAPVRIIEAPEALEDEDLLEMVNAGLMPATIVDDYLAAFWSNVFEAIHVQQADVRSDGQIAWAIRKNSPQLHEAVEAFVRSNPRGSRNYNVIYQKYLKTTDYVKNSASESEMRKLGKIRAFFEKYGAQYDLPWLLIAAQGYQESQLDQTRKSRAGAVGVMQIKPSTAAAPPISITGVDASAEKNIQAGTKYLRFVVDEYYKDAPMDRVEKGLFAMASYNAGPARIEQLRKKTAALGLNPNKWFGNVEVVAARDIGRETVTYVSNIFKYYVAYNLVMEQDAARRRARGQ